MHPLDNFIRDKFLEDIQIIFKEYEIEESISPPGALIRNWIFTDNFGEEVFELYTKHYKRNCAILEVLATKQDLDTERQVFWPSKKPYN